MFRLVAKKKVTVNMIIAFNSRVIIIPLSYVVQATLNYYIAIKCAALIKNHDYKTT